MATAWQINELEGRLKALWARYGTSPPPAILEEIQGLTDELSTLVEGAKAGGLRRRAGELDRYLNEPTWRPPQPGPRGGGGAGALSGIISGKALGDAFIASSAFKNFDGHSSPVAEIEFKTLLDTSTWVPESARIDRIEPYPTAPLAVADLFAQGETNQATVPYLEESTFTNTAAETAEGATKPEATLAFTEKTATVRTIAVFLPVSRQLMDDVVAARSYVGSRLGDMVRQRLDGQLLNGSGVAPNLTGILNTSGIQTQAKGTDPVPDCIEKAMTLVEVNSFYPCDGIVLHPNDWRDIKLLRTADGQYIFGHPSAVTPPQMWGIRVIPTTRIAEGTGLVGSFKGAAQLFYRSALEISVSDSHSDYFIRNQLAVRAEIRVALACFRPSAFCTVTNI
jgi:hypothetical protein